MPAPPSLARVLASSGSIGTGVLLSCVYIYARMQPQRSLVDSPGPPVTPQAESSNKPRSFRSWMVSTKLARHRFRFHMRDGSRVSCRIVDSGGLLGVHVDRDYDITGLDWSRVRTIVDIGAHVGSFTIWAALRSPNATLLAVEPNPETFAFLSQNLRDNALEGRVKAVNVALGSAPRVGSLEFVEHSLGTRLAANGKGQVSVEVQNIEALLTDAGMDQVDILKMDCEGAEYEVFAAMSLDRLRRVQAIGCEYHPAPEHNVSELDAILRSAGFTVQRPDASLGVLWATR